MDLSKLPKLSGQDRHPTPTAGQPPPPAEEFTPGSAPKHPPPPPFDRESTFSTPGGALISVIIGVIFVYLGLPFAKWVVATSSGQTFNTGVIWSPGTPNAGQPVSYWDLQGGTAWTDCGMFLFGFSALIDAAVVLVSLNCRRQGSRTTALLIGFFVTAVATVANLLVCVKIFSLGILPLFSLIAVGVGAFMLTERYPILFGRKTGSLAQQ